MTDVKERALVLALEFCRFEGSYSIEGVLAAAKKFEAFLDGAKV